ncbi:hypothetical protein [Thiohalocapsa marina]|uniref:hypothetical protein n=1 Tax=Thiohalocapsa marina TaxID=424902 RepID=UPI0036D7E128
MPRHYSTKNLFRQMPNVLLARYCHERALFSDLDVATMKEGAPDALFAAWQALPNAQRAPVEVELCQIFDMSCEKGWLAILDEARWQAGEDTQGLATFSEEELSSAGRWSQSASVWTKKPA